MAARSRRRTIGFYGADNDGLVEPVRKRRFPIVGGGGGGRPDFAEAGGKQPEKIDEMMAASETILAKLLGA